MLYPIELSGQRGDGRDRRLAEGLTHVIPNRRDRIATIIAAPFMTCSARLPVYALLIAAFVPAQDVGFMNLQGLILFGLYMFGIVAGVLTALLIRKTALRGPKTPFALMLPEFRRPNIRTVLMQLLGRARVFLRRAGTVIFAVAVIVWGLAYYPRAIDIDPSLTDNEAAAAQLEQSWLGRAGHVVEPVFAPNRAWPCDGTKPGAQWRGHRRAPLPVPVPTQPHSAKTTPGLRRALPLDGTGHRGNLVRKT